MIAANHLLIALPREARARLLPHLELVPLSVGQVLYGSGDAMSHVYFPIDCIVSLLHETEDGATAEISMVGNEGLVGVAIFMGGDSTPSRAMVQSSGLAYRLTAQRLKEEFNRHGELLVLMLRYTQSLITQVAQTVVCNRRHSIDQQLCRSLLHALDRLPDNQVSMTQALLASMLGVRREGVTEAAGKLQRLGVIEYSRGCIRVLDRRRLEGLSCECYAVVKAETDRLLPFLSSIEAPTRPLEPRPEVRALSMRPRTIVQRTQAAA
jgi:CRP-like cAMP-binding protein